MPYMPVTASMFLLAETRDQPIHVGGLQLFIPREGQSSTELSEEIFETFQACTDIHPLFRKRPAQPVSLIGSLMWSFDDEIDFDYHVRRAVLPRPGRIRELFRYVSLHHGDLLDRNRPMWEVHIIDGLEDGRVALYTKIHHSVVDGVSALRLLERTLSPNPDDRTGTAPWNPALIQSRPKPSAPSKGLLSRVGDIAGAATGVVGQAAGLGVAAAKVAYTGITDDAFVPPLHAAPKTILDVPIGSARRFAAQRWELRRLRAIADELQITINDVMVAMCSGAMRAYLIDQDALPDAPLIAAMPVSMHSDNDADGNNITAIMVNLATDQPDPERRLATIVASTRKSKEVVRGMSPLQALALGAANFAPLAFATVPGFVRYTPPQFNLIISNVPGPKVDMYWNGAKLDGVYPASIPLGGQAINITVATTSDYINFGLTGARKEVPSLQRLLTHLDTSLEELEKVAHVRS